MKITSSAPGRICLFGDHQDYLGFPVIAAAIDMRLNIEGNVDLQGDDNLCIELPDIGETVTFRSDDIQYTAPRQYLKSSVNVLKARGLYTPATVEARIRSTIPIQAGTSSSAALSVAWLGFLLQVSRAAGKDASRYLDNPLEVAELAYLAEVVEFNESGGKMDQYASAIGGIVYLDFQGGITASPLPHSEQVSEFVLGDSLQPKNTLHTLKRVRLAQEEGFRQLAGVMSFDAPFHVTYEDAKPYFDKISSDSLPYLKAALTNHAITDKAREELSKPQPDARLIADLMNCHQQQLRDNLEVSTEKIDRMIDSALGAGAMAAKINGSGEGGCMLAFCPGKQQEVAEAIQRSGGKPYIINIGKGLISKK